MQKRSLGHIANSLFTPLGIKVKMAEYRLGLLILIWIIPKNASLVKLSLICNTPDPLHGSVGTPTV